MPQDMKKKIKHLLIMLTLLTSVFVTISSAPSLKAETKIISITPSSGYVGTTVHVVANITTANGEYVIQFNNENRTVGKANETLVDAFITVPQAKQGDHNITIIDLTTLERHSVTFKVLTSCLLKTDAPEPPIQLREGDSFKIFINITGGQADKVYVANVTVLTPDNKSYTGMFNIQTSGVGSGNITKTYPEDFLSAHTNITGTYNIFLNATLAKTVFIGLTNSTIYHRLQRVDIKAVYAPYENVTLTIVGGKVFHSVNRTADDKGVVHYTEWPIPENATIGSYKITIISTSNITRKTPPDIQNFTVPGFKIQVCTRNLAEETVSNVTIKVHDQWANQTYNGIASNSTGFANIMLEVGEHNFTAYYKGVKVNQTLVFIEGERTFNITCQLTNLNITVVSAQNQAIKIPFVSLTLYYNFTTDLDGEKSANATASIQTDITGTAKLQSLLLEASYEVNATRYGHIFNQNNNTFSYLKPYAWNNITIICPERVLRMHVVDGDGYPIENAIIEAQEFMGGLPYKNSTNHDGNATLHCIFGKYHVRVYSNKTLLEETTVELFDDKNVTIRCILYNLTIYVKVIDYFGQPIPNANVTLERNGDVICSKLTGTDGFAHFSENGGELTIKVYLAESVLPEASITVYVGEKRDYANPIVVKVGKYIVLAGFLVDAAQFAMAILVLATIVLIVIIEIVRRKRVKPSKTSS